MSKHAPTPSLRLVVDNSSGGAPLLCPNELSDLLRRLGPTPPPRPQAPHKFSIVHRQPTERRFGHVRVTEKRVDLGKKCRFLAHDDDYDNGQMPIRQWAQTHVQLARPVGILPRMATDVFKQRLKALVDEKFDGNMARASRESAVSETGVRDALVRRDGPRLRTLYKLAAGLEVSVSYLVGETNVRDAEILRHLDPDDLGELLEVWGQLGPDARDMLISSAQEALKRQERRAQRAARGATAKKERAAAGG